MVSDIFGTGVLGHFESPAVSRGRATGRFSKIRAFLSKAFSYLGTSRCQRSQYLFVLGKNFIVG